ncbi:phosphotransferase family protein [Sphingobium sp. Sx8-8]|uniref:phosphotransferase family protein n=1 Tax=Sphingobium sp. Sx8-8 TaxID=2933617 RepID=UPI001F58B54A
MPELIASVRHEIEMRQRVLDGAVGELRSIAAGTIKDHAARDALDNVIRCLALVAVQDGWNEADTNEYAQHAGLSVPDTNDPGWTGFHKLRSTRPVQLTARLMQAEAHMLAKIESRRDAVGTAQGRQQATAATADSISSQLAPYLYNRFGPGIELIACEEVPGGRSKETYLLTVNANPALPTRMVLRLDRKRAFIASQAAAEASVIVALGKLGGMPVPDLLAAEADPSILGGTFLITTRMSGVKAGEYFPELHPLLPDIVPAVIELGAVLGRLHSADPERFGIVPGRVRAAAIRARIEEIYLKTLKAGLVAVEFEAAYRWLLDHVEASEGPLCFVHGDLGLHNILVGNGRLTALLDWELSGPGAAAEDLGSLSHVLDFLNIHEEFNSSYVDGGGSSSSLELEHMNFYKILRQFKVIQAGVTARNMYLSRETEDFVLANAGFDFALRCRTILAQTMASIYKEAGEINDNEI